MYETGSKRAGSPKVISVSLSLFSFQGDDVPLTEQTVTQVREGVLQQHLSQSRLLCLIAALRFTHDSFKKMSPWWSGFTALTLRTSHRAAANLGSRVRLPHVNMMANYWRLSASDGSPWLP